MTLKPVFPVIALLLAGCAVGPDFQTPQASLQQRFVGGSAAEIGAVAQKRWWQDYRDPMLNDLVGRGLSQGLDMVAAIERIQQAQANLRATGVNSALSGNLTASQTRSGGDGMVTGNSGSAQLGAGFVIDLFGGIQREREGATARLAGAQADAETTRLAWLAELVAAYSNARYYQGALALTRNTIATRKETVAITKQRFELGDATEYELAQADALLATARAALPQYLALFNANVFAIGTLLNEPSGPIMARMQKGAPQLRTPAGSATGLPAELLRNRPDVRSAELALAAAVADVGVAESDLYPALSLTGNLGRTSGANSWSFGPALTLPVFNQGALKAARDARISLAKQAEIEWRAQVLSAVEDVQLAQSNLSQYRSRAAALRRAAASYEKALTLARENYRAGAITLLDLLDTDRSAAAARVSAASAVNDAAQAWASLQLAIGAGAGAATAPR